MGSEVPARSKRRRRTIAAAVGASSALVLFVAGLAFSNSVGASRVAENATALHWVNAALGTTSLTRAALVQAATFVELEERGLVGHDDVDFALGEVEAAREELAGLSLAGTEADGPSLEPLNGFNELAGSTVEYLRAGDYESAERLLVGDIETAYRGLSRSLQAAQRSIQSQIETNTEVAARANSYIVFILTLAIPGAAVLTYWWIARRQVHEYRIKADAELEAERAVSRAKDSFIAGLSHELRTPLTSIYGFAEILTDGDQADQAPEIARIIANEAAEMSRMVDDLLTAARLESTGVEIDLVPVRVEDVVESAVTPFVRAGAVVGLSQSGEIVRADGGRLRHVLVNLVSNALRHGGPRIGIDVVSEDGTVDIEVWDDGPGVPEEQVERLFERFVHDGARSLLTGSVGLGLAVASRLTAMMGGSLSYQRFAGKTRFIVRLPTHEPGPGSGADGDDERVGESVEVGSS